MGWNNSLKTKKLTDARLMIEERSLINKRDTGDGNAVYSTGGK